MSHEKTYTLGDYRTRLQQLREAVAQEFPERAGTVFIVDQTNDPQTELANAAKALNIDVPELKENLDKLGIDFASQTGVARPFVTKDGRTVWLTFGWVDAETRAKGTDHAISEEDMFGYTKAALHELGHALQMHNEPLEQTLNVINGTSLVRYRESFAELYASDMLMRNGLAIPGALDTVMTNYDLERIDKPYKQYLPADEYTELLQRHYPVAPTYNPDNFKGFTGLRDSLERTRAIGLAHQEKGMDAMAAYANDDAIKVVVNDLKKRGFTPEQVTDWLCERADIFPHVMHSIKAAEYLDDSNKRFSDYQEAHTPLEQQTYPSYQSRPVQWSLERSAALAAQKAAETNDPTDRKLAESLLVALLSSDTLGYAKPQGLSDAQEDALLSNPKYTAWAETILKGGSFEQALPAMKKFAQEYIEAHPSPEGGHTPSNPPAPQPASPATSVSPR